MLSVTWRLLSFVPRSRRDTFPVNTPNVFVLIRNEGVKWTWVDAAQAPWIVVYENGPHSLSTLSTRDATFTWVLESVIVGLLYEPTSNHRIAHKNFHYHSPGNVYIFCLSFRYPQNRIEEKPKEIGLEFHITPKLSIVISENAIFLCRLRRRKFFFLSNISACLLLQPRFSHNISFTTCARNSSWLSTQIPLPTDTPITYNLTVLVFWAGFAFHTFLSTFLRRIIYTISVFIFIDLASDCV